MSHPAEAAVDATSPHMAPAMTPVGALPVPESTLDSAARAYVAAAATEGGRRSRQRGVAGFVNRYGDLDSWAAAPVEERRGTRGDMLAFIGHALVHCHVPVDLNRPGSAGDCG